MLRYPGYRAVGSHILVDISLDRVVVLCGYSYSTWHSYWDRLPGPGGWLYTGQRFVLKNTDIQS